MATSKTSITKEREKHIRKAIRDLRRLEAEIAPFIKKKKRPVGEIKEENWHKSSTYLIS